MKRWRIKYRDFDPACPMFSLTVNADDREQAELAFWDIDNPDDYAWAIASITRVPSGR